MPNSSCTIQDEIPITRRDHEKRNGLALRVELFIILMRLHKRNCVSNHRHLIFMFNSLFGSTKQKLSKRRITGPLWRYSASQRRIPLTKPRQCGKYFHIMVTWYITKRVNYISDTLSMYVFIDSTKSWWRHQMETFSALLALCEWGEFTGHRWIPPTKASDAELWCFLWSAPWINGWINNGEAGDLRRHRALYDVIVVLWDRSSATLLGNITSYCNPIYRRMITTFMSHWMLSLAHGMYCTGPLVINTGFPGINTNNIAFWNDFIYQLTVPM